jgi:hypothetical protein
MLVLSVGSSLTPIVLWSSSSSTTRSQGTVGYPLFVAQDISSYLSLALEKEPKSFHISPSVTKARVPQEQKKTTKIAKVEGDDEKEFQWLNWVYCRWTQCPPGTIPPAVLKQMEPAISRWGRRKSLVGAERAEELLERLIQEYLLGNPHLDLSVSLFNSAMDAYAKVGNPQGVQRILRRMREIRRNHKSETPGSTRIQNGRSALDFSHLVPDVISMSTLATAWAKSRSPEASAMVESILCYMETKDLVPNLITYNSVLHAVATSGGLKMDRGMRAQRIIDSMKDNGCEPDVYSYQMLIQAWSKTIVDNAPERAERILKHLEDEAYQGNKQLAANAHCYTGRFRCLVGYLSQNRLIYPY